MKLLTDFPDSDAVSEALRFLRVRSTIYCRSEMRAPWGFAAEAPGAAAFHLVTAGRCWLEVEDEPEPRHLRPGDLVVLPTGRRHRLCDDPGTPAPELSQILAETPMESGLRLRYGGRGAKTILLCGGFAIEGDGAHPVLDALPPVVQITASGGQPPPWLEATVEQLRVETESPAPGAQVVVSRLADALLTQALRYALIELGPDAHAGLRALRDPRIAAAVHLIHRHPERPWTVGALADEVAMSRSAFSARFRKLVGQSPMRYITRCRLAHAAGLLQSTDATLAEIARRSGYETEFSFSRAFKRAFGLAPGVYRGRADDFTISESSGWRRGSAGAPE